MPITLERIQELTGHPSADAVRMALRRAKVRAEGIVMGTGAWPPKKTYPEDAVWRAFGSRITERAASDPAVKELAWKTFAKHIRQDAVAQDAGEVFSDRIAD